MKKRCRIENSQLILRSRDVIIIVIQDLIVAIGGQTYKSLDDHL